MLINPTGLDWHRFQVAISPQGELLGCGQIKSHADGLLELASIAVMKHTRGKGIGRAVIETLLALESSRPLYLMCRARLESLYEKFDFYTVQFEEMPPYFRRICYAERIFNRKSQNHDRLLVMRLD